MDYNTAFAMTSELVAMEVINRVFICIFEVSYMCVKNVNFMAYKFTLLDSNFCQIDHVNSIVKAAWLVTYCLSDVAFGSLANLGQVLIHMTIHVLKYCVISLYSMVTDLGYSTLFFFKYNYLKIMRSHIEILP